MMKTWRLLVLAIGVGSLAGSVAMAEGESPTPDVAPIVASDVAPAAALDVPPPVEPEAGEAPANFGLSFRSDYTDNRDSTEHGKESNLDFYVTPRIDFYADPNAGQTTFDFFYEPSLRYRDNPSDIQNDWEVLHNTGFNANHAFSEQTKLRVLELFNYQDDPAIEEGGSQVRDNRTYYLNRAELGLNHRLNNRTTGEVLGRHTLKRYKEDDVAAESDEDRAEGEISLRHNLTRPLAIHGMAGMSAYGYDSAIGIDRDFNVVIGAIGLAYVLSPEVHGGVDVGAQSVEYSDSSLNSDVFPYARVDVTVAPVPTFRLKGLLGHGVRNSDVYPFASQEYTEIRGGAEVDASSIVTVGLSATLRLSEYDEDVRPAGAPAPLPAQETSGDETTTVVSGHLEWKLPETARLQLRQVYEDVDSDVEESFQKNTTSVELHLDF